jgi:hypothetical protein
MLTLELLDICEKFRAGEKLEDLATIVGDANAIRLLAAWRNARPAWKKPKRKQPSNPPDLWQWIWDGVHYDREALANAAKLNEQATHKLLHLCANARVIYPDGTISKHAADLVAAHTKTRFPGRLKEEGPEG